jgi:hypothetical protein
MLKLTSGSLGRMVPDVKSPSRLRKARNCFPKWASEEPQHSISDVARGNRRATQAFSIKKSPQRS